MNAGASHGKRKFENCRSQKVYGGRHIQTIKQESGENSALFTRDKWEHQIGGRRPDLDVARDAALGPVFSKKVRHSLKPIFETRVRRTVYPIQSGDSEIELTIDCRH